MGIETPGKRWGKRLQKSKVFGHGGLGGKKNMNSDLLITPLVDMFVIIVLFLMANFSATGEILNMSKDIVLPDAQHIKQLEDVPVVKVTKDEVFVNEALIGRVDDLTKDEYLNIPQLEEKLREQKKKFDDVHANVDGQTSKADVNIQAHKEVQFKIIKKIMFACASAGFGNINFATLNSSKKSGGSATTAMR